MINPDAIPRIDGDMDALTAHADSIETTGIAIAATGALVHQTWQGLAAVYRAPEDTQLLAATGMVMTVSASAGEDIEDAAGALRDYATETAAIQVRLDDLRAQAVSLIAAAAAAQDESTTVTLDDRSAALDAAVAAQIAAWEATQLRCANALRGLTGAPGLSSFTAATTIVPPGRGLIITPPAPSGPLQQIFPIDSSPPVSSTGNPPVIGGPSILINVPAPSGTGVVDGPGSFAPIFGGVFADQATGGTPPRLPPKVRGKLGGLVGQAGETVADVIRQRGGGASQIGQLQTGYGELTLGEVARRAVAGDPEAEKAMKMVKQAGTTGKGDK